MRQSGTIGVLRAEHTPELTFGQWVWYVRENRLYLLLSAGLMLIQFIVFKSLFPNPDFLPESYVYLEMAAANKDVSIWSVGYAKFLRLGSLFTHSATALVLFQYLVLQLCILYFIFTLTYFLRPGKIITCLLFFIGVVDPLLLHVSNLISSDALFTALSICWATQLLWIMKGARLPLLVIHALLLLLVFTLSYNALYYPVISMVMIAISRSYTLFKLAANLLIFVFIGGYIVHTVKTYQRETGTQQFFAPGPGNALYTYGYTTPEPATKIPSRLRPLHAVIHHMDSLRQVRVWQWSAMAPLYGSYGAYAMRKYPGLYVKYYLLPNLITFYVPEAESLGGISAPYTLIIALSNLCFLTGCIIFFVINGFKSGGYLSKILLGAFILWFANGIFSIMAGPIMLRYQLFPMIMSGAFSLVMIEYFIDAANADEPKTVNLRADDAPVLVSESLH
ncbi:hypothetical protein SAMN04488505_102690 [Chitinophaga rupis]|uniref:Dolichyl-phosphate-mannose-protein mannosyltransferase n=1 Tax=Chitinophaga rupis TaxID=573321 RepID=A0A1H7RPS1_9BACT|nr:hypothetical protein [Chitinophaga rupis]SEL61814.1 hypothetical protein SAMN04488505_102690 [Chitinophaga rupis]